MFADYANTKSLEISINYDHFHSLVTPYNMDNMMIQVYKTHYSTYLISISFDLTTS